jgi:hypothetical protein
MARFTEWLGRYPTTETGDVIIYLPMGALIFLGSVIGIIVLTEIGNKIFGDKKGVFF